MRLGPVLGRRKQMIKFKGTTIYPAALYDILNDIPEITNYVVEAYTNDIGTDEINIKLNSGRQDEEFSKMIKDHFRAKLRVSPAIEFIGAAEIDRLKFPENSRKAVVFHDRRAKN